VARERRKIIPQAIKLASKEIEGSKFAQVLR